MVEATLGYIGNNPRKDALEEEIIHNVAPVSSLISMEKVENLTVEKIVVFGSWARGEATPFVSDIDVIIKASGINSDEPFVNPSFSVSKRFLQFNGIDTKIYFDEEKFNDMLVYFMMDSTPNVAYDLTNKKRITVDEVKTRA